MSIESRILGKSGIKVSSLGFGAWGIGGPYAGTTCYGPTDDAVSLRALDVALECGITFYDTAPTYGGGHSETLLGKAFAQKRDQVILAGKAGYERFDQPPDWSVPSMARVFDDSLRRLNSDYMDILQIYNPSLAVLNAPEVIHTWIDTLRRQGSIRAFGVSVKTPEEGLLAIKNMNPDAIQVNFNLLDQRVIDCQLLSRAEEAKVALIARTPLCFGFLTGTIDESTPFDKSDHRSLWSRKRILEWIQGGRKLADLAHKHQLLPIAAALRYPLSFPSSVATVIPGMMQEREVRENVGFVQGGALPEQMVTAIRDFYESHNRFRPG